MAFLLKGIIIGIIVSAPMGPIGVLCIQKTVNKGRFFGFFSGMGAATADTLYAILAVFGVTFITDFLSKNQLFLQVIGIVVLLYLGLRMILNNPIKQYRYYRSGIKRNNFIKDFISVFFLTLSNPLTIIFFGAAFTMFGLINSPAETINYKYILILGVFGGASFWWFLLSSLVDKFRKRFRLRNILVINRVSGIMIVTLTVIAAVKLFLL